MRSPLALTTTLAVVVALGLTGCASSPADSAAPSASASPTAASPSPSPTPSATPVALACDTVLDQASIDSFAGQQYELSDDFAQRAVDQGWPEAAFVTNGGLLCQWGYPQSDATEYYGLSELSAENTTTIEARLVSEGFIAEPHDDGDLYVGPKSDERPQLFYFFADGHWYVGFSAERIDEIRRNAGLS